MLAIAAGVLILPGGGLLRALNPRHAASQPTVTRAAGPGSTTPAATNPSSAPPNSTATAPTRAGHPPAPAATLRGARFGWAPISGARYYVVRFFRGGRLVFQAKPAQPTLVLPAHWRFGGRSYRLLAGRYRWSVVPRLGRSGAHRYGRPVVSAVWVARPGRVGP